MILTTRRQASRPLSMSACLNIVSADPVRHIERRPQIAALIVRCCSSVMKWPTTLSNASSSMRILSCFSAHLRILISAGHLEIRYRSVLDFHATPPFWPSKRYSGCVAILSS